MGGLQKKQAQSDGALKAGRYRMLEDSGELEWRRAARSVGLSILRRLVNFLDIHLNTPLPKYLLYFTADPYCIILAITLKHLIVFFKKKTHPKKVFGEILEKKLSPRQSSLLRKSYNWLVT